MYKFKCTPTNSIKLGGELTTHMGAILNTTPNNVKKLYSNIIQNVMFAPLRGFYSEFNRELADKCYCVLCML
jgi:hypothetical protein